MLWGKVKEKEMVKAMALTQTKQKQPNRARVVDVVERDEHDSTFRDAGVMKDKHNINMYHIL